jgi:hypothetical protein
MRAGKARQLSEEEAEEADFARLQRWDAEIEAGFQRVVAATKTAGRKKRRPRVVGFPFAFLADVCRLTEGRATLVVAELIYRRTYVCNSRTVTLSDAELAEMEITRSQKYKALARLEAAGILRIEKGGAGRTVKVTLLWQAG